MKKSTLGVNKRLSYTAMTYSSTIGSYGAPLLVSAKLLLESPNELEISSIATILLSTKPFKYVM